MKQIVSIMGGGILILCFLFPVYGQTPNIWINEIHYNNAGSDTAEGVEIITPDKFKDYTELTLSLYNGSDGKVYDSRTLDSFTKGDVSNGFQIFYKIFPNIQNDMEGMSLSYVNPYTGKQILIQFISYNGTFKAMDGPAAGETSKDIGVTESNSTPIGVSLQLTGSGNKYADFNWQQDKSQNYGSLNSEQSFTSFQPQTAPDAWINEIHYDNDGPDTLEDVEVIVPTSFKNLDNLILSLYNGSDGKVYYTSSLSDFSIGKVYKDFAIYYKYIKDIQNGPDGLTLAYYNPNSGSSILQFLSYEGTFGAIDGIAKGLTSQDIGVEEKTYSTKIGQSLQLKGSGNKYKDFKWDQPKEATTGDINDHQSIQMSDGSVTIGMTIKGQAGWRMLSVPVNGLKMEDIAKLTPIQGYNGHNPGAVKNFYVGYDGITFVAPNDLTGTLTAGQGYILYFYNNDLSGSKKLPINLVMKGTPNAQDVTIPVHNNGNCWNLVGNPYLSSINISSVIVNGGALASGVGQIWDANSGSYITTTTNNGEVAGAQGFFIQNNNATSITIPVSAKSNQITFYKGIQNSNDERMIQLQLKTENPDDGVTTTDKNIVLYFNKKSNPGWDYYDAIKLTPLTARFATLSFEGTKNGRHVALAQDSRAYDLTKPQEYKLEMNISRQYGHFSIKWPVWKNIPSNWSISMTDNKTNQKIDMRTDTLYSFDISKTAIQNKSVESSIHQLPTTMAATGKARFEITITPKDLTAISDKDKLGVPNHIKLFQNYPNPFNPTTQIEYSLPKAAEVSLKIYDILGRQVAVLAKGTKKAGNYRITWNASNMASGIYIYQLKVDDVIKSRKMLLLK